MFAAILELDQFLKEEEEERREKEEKVSCPILQRGADNIHTIRMHLYKCKRDVEDYKMLEWPLSYFKYLTSPVKVDKLLSSALDFIDSAVSLSFHTPHIKMTGVCCRHSV